MSMDCLIVDLEATCWLDGTKPGRQEVIEIGAVRVRAPHFQPDETFARFVRPTREPELIDFCTELTGIQQSDVDTADPFPTGWAEFLDWAGPDPYRLASWGAYDLKQLTIECQRLGLPLPASFANHLNLKNAFAAAHNTRPSGMARALSLCGLPLTGSHHRALDDALNIAKLASLVHGLSPEAGDEHDLR